MSGESDRSTANRRNNIKGGKPETTAVTSNDLQ